MFGSEVDQALALDGKRAIDALAAMREGQWFEKKSGRVSSRDLAVPLVALANAEGGHVLVGMGDDGTIDGVDPARIEEIRQCAQGFTVPPVRCRTRVLHGAPGLAPVLLQVDPGERVHETSKGECYLRVGDQSRRLGFAQRQELEYDRGSTLFDGSAVQVSTSELDEAQVHEYQRSIRSSSPDSMLRARSLLTRGGQPTVAAYLLFAARPQDLFPNALVRVLRYRESERGTGADLTLDAEADIRCEGSLPLQIAQAEASVTRLIAKRRRLTESGKFEAVPIIPRDAWLEAIVNAVIHRSYSMAGDHVRVELFPDRLEVSSPGRFPGLVDARNPLTIARYARNPRIARVCADLGIAQELGEGIKRIYREMRTVGLTEPIYAETAGSVRLTLSAADAIPAELRESLRVPAKLILNALRLAGRPLGTGQVAELVGLSRPAAGKHLRQLQEAGLVSWEGQSAKDPRATWRVV